RKDIVPCSYKEVDERTGEPSPNALEEVPYRLEEAGNILSNVLEEVDEWSGKPSADHLHEVPDVTPDHCEELTQLLVVLDDDNDDCDQGNDREHDQADRIGIHRSIQDPLCHGPGVLGNRHESGPYDIQLQE